MHFEINFMNKNIIVVSLAVLVVGGGAFFGGMKYQESKNAASLMKNFQGMPGGGQLPDGARANRNGGGGMVAGEIAGIDGETITVKTANGGSKFVFFSDKTSIGNFVAAAASDLREGQKITAIGTAAGDGGITAASIQIGAQNMGRGPAGIPTPGIPTDEKQEDSAVQPVM